VRHQTCNSTPKLHVVSNDFRFKNLYMYAKSINLSLFDSAKM
jgi:hypothetical protein